jgi:acetyltransferase-like isoleucine patch superfamily enzyme
LYAYYNLIKFSLKKHIFGFDVANQYLQRVDKISLQLILKKNGAHIGDDCDIETGLIIHNCNNYKNLVIGDNCHIGKNCFFDLRSKIEIGNNVVISMKCTFITHLDMNKSKLRVLFPATTECIKIQDDVYIGANSTIIMRVNLGKGSFIAGGAFLTMNVEPSTMVGGVPAKIIKTIKT